MKIEQFGLFLAKRLGEPLHYSEEQIAVLAYGLFGIIQTLLSIVIVIILGTLLGATLEALIVSFSIAILRKSSGGAHATSAERCLILGTFLSLLGAMLAYLLTTTLTLTLIYCITFLLFVWSFYAVYKKAPVATPNKPIKSTHKQQKLKQESLLIVTIYLVIVLLLLLISTFIETSSVLIYSICLTLGMSWQVFTITNIGHQVIHFLDHVLIYISNLITKENQL